MIENSAGMNKANLSSNDVNAVVRLIGLGLLPFDTSEQAAFKAALDVVLPTIAEFGQVHKLGSNRRFFLCIQYYKLPSLQKII